MGKGYAPCGQTIDHDKHLSEIEGIIIMCDGKVEQ